MRAKRAGRVCLNRIHSLRPKREDSATRVSRRPDVGVTAEIARTALKKAADGFVLGIRGEGPWLRELISATTLPSRNTLSPAHSRFLANAVLPGVLYVSAEINTDRVEFHKAAFSAQRERTAERPGEKMSQISTNFFIFLKFWGKLGRERR